MTIIEFERFKTLYGLKKSHTHLLSVKFINYCDVTRIQQQKTKKCYYDVTKDIRPTAYKDPPPPKDRQRIDNICTCTLYCRWALSSLVK